MTGPGEEPGATERAAERAAKNTLVRAVGDLLGKLASLVLFAAMARTLGEDGLGVFVLAFAFGQIATLPTGLGLDRYFLRRVAKDRARVDELFNVLALKLALALPAVALALIAVELLGYDGTTRDAIFLLLPGLLLESLGRTLHSVYNAYERAELLAFSSLVQRIVAAALGLAALAAGYGVVTIAGTYTAAAALGLVLSLSLLRRGIGLPPVVVARRVWRELTVHSLPFAAQDIFGNLLSRLDTLILAQLATQAAVGRYGAAYRLLEATYFLTWAVNGAFAAMYTYLDRDTTPTIQAAFERSLKLLLVFLVPCALLFGLLAEPISVLFFGSEFDDAAGPIRLLAPVIVLIGIVYLTTSLIVSRRSATIMVYVIGALLTINVAANLVLIPAYEDNGAAAAMLITEVVGAAVVLWIAARTIGGLRPRLLLSPLAAGLAMAAPLVLLGSVPLAAGAIGVACYVGVFVLVERRLNPADLDIVVGMVRRRLGARA